MKKLNMNEPGSKMAGWIVIFLALIPTALWTIGFISHRLHDSLFFIPIRVSLAIGCTLAVVLFILVMVELKQDRHITERYQVQRHQKLPLADGFYECQYCGNRRLRARDHSCPVCGKVLSGADDPGTKV